MIIIPNCIIQTQQLVVNCVLFLNIQKQLLLSPMVWVGHCELSYTTVVVSTSTSDQNCFSVRCVRHTEQAVYTAHTLYYCIHWVLYEWTYIRTYIYVCMYAYTHTTYTYTTHATTHRHAHPQAYTCMHACMHAHTHARMHARTHTRTHARTHTHTHTHTKAYFNIT